MITFSRLAHFSYNMKHAIGPCEYLMHHQSEDSRAYLVVIHVPTHQIMLSIEFKRLSYFELVVQFFFFWVCIYVLGATYTTHTIRQVIELGMSTLF